MWSPVFVYQTTILDPKDECENFIVNNNKDNFQTPGIHTHDKVDEIQVIQLEKELTYFKCLSLNGLGIIYLM
jgi:hypothetical protein